MLPGRTTLPRKLRMTASDEFKSALRTRPIAQGRIFSLHWYDCKDLKDFDPVAKLGFIVPKRILRLAVDRNRIKRVLRESFRTSQANLPVGFYLFRLKSRPPIHSKSTLKHAARTEADFLLKKMSLKT